MNWVHIIRWGRMGITILVSKKERQISFTRWKLVTSPSCPSHYSFFNVFHSMWFVHAQMYISNSILHIQLSLLIQTYHGFMSVEYHQSSYVNLHLISTNKISCSVRNVHVNSRACKVLTYVYKFSNNIKSNNS